MAGLFDKQAELYASARPDYSRDWYAKLASLTAHHKLAWDVGTGNDQAALGVLNFQDSIQHSRFREFSSIVSTNSSLLPPTSCKSDAEHFETVIATDVSEAQLRIAVPHQNVRCIHTPVATSADDLIHLLGGEGSVDLITVAQAVHWFDLPRFYSAASRALRKPGSVIAVWGYNDVDVCPAFDDVFSIFHATTLPFWDPRIRHLFNGYRSLPFPFESVGVGSEGEPAVLELEKEVSFEGFMAMVRSWSALLTAKERGVDLLSERVVEELREAWCGGGHAGSDDDDHLVRKITYKAFMLAGTPRIEE